ncbi:uncharacterized protein C2845_PM14G14510 [Panicum miliaceum]|uniref:Uncharacterized protein n=1 Tax=Panicum miliaceum TaxID=4540 RepID=A0A3L6PSD2_PANMI|nr:uncharacterized protein C2845_PM14G14510 [Panicum miliaceum]
MATLHIKPLHGADGYLRWKESVLLRLHTVGVAHVLSDDPPAAGAQEARSGRATTRCAGAASSRRSRTTCSRSTSGTAPAGLWRAVARTYKPDSFSWQLKFEELEFRDEETLLERVARAEALAIAASMFLETHDALVACKVCAKLPDVAEDAIMHGDETTMDGVWRSAQAMERVRNCRQARVVRQEREDMISSWSCGMSGHVAKKCR